MMAFDRVSNLEIKSDMPVKSITATEWLVGYIDAPWVGSFTIKGDAKRRIAGDLSMDMDLSGVGAPKGLALGSVKVAGTISGGYWLIAGNISAVQMAASDPSFEMSVDDYNLASLKAIGNKSFGIPATLSGDFSFNSVKSISAGDFNNAFLNLFRSPDSAGKILALGTLTVKGQINNCQISSTGNIGTVTAGKIVDTSCFAGVEDGITDLPAADSDSFSETATIKSFTIKGYKGIGSYVINSNIAAAKILSVSLAYPQNNNGGKPFGITADYIKKLMIKDAAGPISLKELNKSGDGGGPYIDAEIRLY
jgi:hypothetical protein